MTIRKICARASRNLLMSDDTTKTASLLAVEKGVFSSTTNKKILFLDGNVGRKAPGKEIAIIKNCFCLIL